MLEDLRKLREEGYPQEFLNRYAQYRQRYRKLPLQERILTDFGYFLRMRYIDFLRKKNDRR